MRGETN
jgi:hypothetical protein